MGPKGGNQVLGLLIDESLPVPTPAAKGLLVDINVRPGELKTVQRLYRLANTAITAHDKMVIKEFKHLVVRLPAKGYGTTEFDMSEERRNALVAAGQQAMANYFDKLASKVAKARAIRGAGIIRGKKVADGIAMKLLRQEKGVA
jgi:hypothetical protein